MKLGAVALSWHLSGLAIQSRKAKNGEAFDGVFLSLQLLSSTDESVHFNLMGNFLVQLNQRV